LILNDKNLIRGRSFAPADGHPGPARGSLIAHAVSWRLAPSRIVPMTDARPTGRRRINWTNVSTVISAAILIAAEVFGAAFAGGWAVSNLLDLGEYGAPAMQAIFFVFGVLVMFVFIRNARRVEPFTLD
jgi:hypothetical protein